MGAAGGMKAGGEIIAAGGLRAAGVMVAMVEGWEYWGPGWQSKEWRQRVGWMQWLG